MINDPKDTSLTVDCSRQGWEEQHSHTVSPKEERADCGIGKSSLDLEQLLLPSVALEQLLLPSVALSLQPQQDLWETQTRGRDALQASGWFRCTGQLGKCWYSGLEASFGVGVCVPCGSVVKNLSANAGDAGSISGSGRSLGGGNGNTLQYSCPGNPMDRGARWPAPHGMTKKSDTTWRLNNTHLTSKLHSEALQLGLKHMTSSGVRMVVEGGCTIQPRTRVYTTMCNRDS